MSILYEIEADLVAADSKRPRSQQIAIGGSGLFGCRAEHVLRLNGVPQSDPRLSWQAFVGSAMDERLGEARKLARPQMLIQERLEYGAVWFTIDEYDPETKTLSDYKTKDNAAACSEAVLMMEEARPGHEQKRAQLHGGAAALIASGYPVDSIQLVFLPRSGGFDGARLFTEPFSREWADKGVEWAAETITLADGFAHDSDPPSEVVAHLRDKPPFFCHAYCPFVSTCRGEGQADTAEPDPMQLDAAQRYIAARFDADEAAARRDYYRDLLAGSPPIVTDGWKIAWSGGNPKTVEEVDDAAVREGYEFIFGSLPVREVVKTSARSLRATKVRK
jgi:hypothetical protein